ncbi:hypothetical protein [Mycobacterium simulans]|uniref:hypothetical protein n=1 Tax=Mycobacterium simulans TaxID=627089 RepID=UPI001CD29D1C|nr:hypothetical protein [Mycobacterium simulans]
MPEHRGLTTMDPEDLVGETVGEGVRIREIDAERVEAWPFDGGSHDYRLASSMPGCARDGRSLNGQLNSLDDAVGLVDRQRVSNLDVAEQDFVGHETPRG